MAYKSINSSLAPAGEVTGSILIGLVKAFQSIQAISGGTATHLIDGIESTSWYPISHYFDVINDVCKYDIDYDPILFRAGMSFIEDWYLNGGGKETMSSAGDFLRLQGSGGGYSSVHRGDPVTIGWQELTQLDESSGSATITCLNPYPKEFERGVFYGGMLLVGDVEYVHVQCVEEPHNRHLNKKTNTIRFVKKPDNETAALLDRIMADTTLENYLPFSNRLCEAIAWRLKYMEQKIRNDSLYFQQSSLLLSKATDEIYKLSHKLENLASFDELTGLLNRRAIFERARNLLSIYSRNKAPISYIMIDVDHFKAINDIWGHATGDKTLRMVSMLLKQRLRDYDLVGRIGGEEFLVVLPDTNMVNALEVAESLRLAIVNHQQFSSSGQRIPLTISLGVTETSVAHSQELEEYIRQADQALYYSKSSGRNRVTCYESA